MTMALPLAFAACTSEEFESFNNQGEGLNNRKDIGNVALMFEGGDAQTRWTAGMAPEVGDRVGVVLIDQNNGGTDEDPMKNYDVKDNQIFTNYMYENDGNAWTTNANLVEGNYYFYAPYVASHQGRSLIKLTTPVVQTIDVDAQGNIDGNSGIANFVKDAQTPFYIGYKFLSAEDDNTAVTVSMKHIFAYPKFTFTNATGEDITLTRVLIQNTAASEDDWFIESGLLKNSAVKSNLFITGDQDSESIAEAMKDVEDEDAPAYSWGAWTKVFGSDKGGKTMPAHLDDLTTKDLLTDDVKRTNLIRIDFSDEVEVADGDEISFRAILPAAEYGKNDLKVYFVMSDGQAWIWENGDVNQTTLMLGDAYAAEDYSNDGSLKNSAKQLELSTEDMNEGTAPNIVTSTEELIELIDDTKSSTKTLEITLAGEEIEFNAEVLATISERLSQNVKFYGLINIVGSDDAEKPMDIDEEVLFDQANVSGYVKLNNNSISYNELTIAKGAALEVADINETYNAEKGDYENEIIINNGSLTLGDKVNTVKNYNELTINDKGEFSTLETDEEKPQTITLNRNYTYNGEKLEGTWTVNAGATLTLGKSYTLPYESELTVNGRLAGNDLTVSGTLNVNGTIANKVIVSGIIDNETTTDVDERKEAIVNLNAGATVTGSVEGQVGVNVDAQIVNIASSVGFMGTFQNANLKATYKHTGSVTKAGDIVLPENVNTLEITGNIALSEYEELKWSNVTDLTVTGVVNALNKAVHMTLGSNSSVKVVGDVLAANNVRLANAKKLEVTGLLETRGTAGIMIPAVEELILNNVILNGGNCEINAVEKATIKGAAQLHQSAAFATEELTLKGNVIVAAGKELRLSVQNNIDGNVTFDGAGKVVIRDDSKDATITLKKNAVLTNETTIEGNSGTSALVFTTEGGQMFNNGKVSNSRIAYSEDAETAAEGKGWWHGNDANKYRTSL